MKNDLDWYPSLTISYVREDDNTTSLKGRLQRKHEVKNGISQITNLLIKNFHPLTKIVIFLRAVQVCGFWFT